jgi:hypothetical protein
VANYRHFDFVQTRLVEFDCGVDCDLQDIKADSETEKKHSKQPKKMRYLATSAGSVSQQVL